MVLKFSLRIKYRDSLNAVVLKQCQVKFHYVIKEINESLQ